MERLPLHMQKVNSLTTFEALHIGEPHSSYADEYGVFYVQETC